MVKPALERVELDAGKLTRTVLRGAGRSDPVSLLDYGYNQLSYVLAMFMPLAFLIDQVQQRCCKLFRSPLAKMKKPAVSGSFAGRIDCSCNHRT